jgi:hypothetical protein
MYGWLIYIYIAEINILPAIGRLDRMPMASEAAVQLPRADNAIAKEKARGSKRWG